VFWCQKGAPRVGLFGRLHHGHGRFGGTTFLRCGVPFCSFKQAVTRGANGRIPQTVLGQLLGPIRLPGAQILLFGPPVSRGLLRKSVHFRVQKKGPAGYAILPPPPLGLADFQSQCGRAGHFFAPSNMPTLAVDLAKSQSPRDLFFWTQK